MSDKNPSLDLSIVFSGLPSSSTAPLQAEPSAARPSSQQIIIPVDRIESVVNQATSNADALHNPAGLETGIAIIDTVTASVGPVQSALAYAETLKGTLDCLAACAGYIDGVIGLLEHFADVSIHLFCCCLSLSLSHQIHPISKIAVGALTKAYDVSGTSRRLCKFN
jgi:hypothetical protein